MGTTYQACTIMITAPATPIRDTMLKYTAHDDQEKRRGDEVGLIITFRVSKGLKGKDRQPEVMTAT